jgi:4-amino-4-deoxy-L-arabinose transferase-like glycosyltransferase
MPRRPVVTARLALRSVSRPSPELALLLVLAAVLNLWALDQNGWANEYYSAAVRSMSSSWHNFLYGSFDASGVMTVDKPPLALWVQAASVKVFGFSSLAILVPQALMGVASVALVYDLTRRRFGRVAGGVAGLVLALTPMTVAISRHNNPDALLVLCCVAALWFAVRALEDGRTKWLVLAGVCVGLGFETKMAVALMVVPGIAAAWMWVAPRGRIAALRQLLAGGAAMVVVGGAWPLLMALTPASDRPWVSGTSDNSIWSLIFGYNGLGRLDGQAGGPQAFGGGGGGNFGGSSGPLRLLNESLGAQGGWLLGFALVGGIGILVSSRLRRSDARSGWLIAVGGAFLVTAVAFSFAKGIFHPYYVSLLAPFTAALVGAAATQLTGAGLAARVVAPLAVAAGVLTELAVLNNSPGELEWLPAVLIVAGVAAVAGLTAFDGARVRSAALAVALGALLIAPATWSVQTLGHATSGTFPAGGSAASSFAGGPGGAGGRGMPAPPQGAAAGAFRGAPPAGGLGGGPGGGSQSLTEVLDYVKQHGGGTIGVSSQTGASSTIISSGADVAGLGGFSGRESEVSVSWLAQAVRSGEIRWVLSDGGGAGGPGRDGRVGSSKVMTAVAATCKQATTTTGGTLYDCQGSAAALTAYAAQTGGS